MKTIRFILQLANWAILILITVMAIYFIAPKFSGYSGYQSFVVQSGSMEPTIMTGDVIISKLKTGTEAYQLNDVVTFNTNSDGNTRIVTHRIIKISDENNNTNYYTKGDANRSEDEDFVSRDQIIGKVVFNIPRLGYFVSFAKTLPGLILLVLIPATIYILNELVRIKNVKQED